MELSAIAGIPAFILDTLYIFTSLASYCSTLEDFHSMVSCFKLKQIKIRLAFTLHFAIATEVFRYPSLEIESTTNRLSSLRRHSGWYASLALIFLILAHKCLEWVSQHYLHIHRVSGSQICLGNTYTPTTASLHVHKTALTLSCPKTK